MKAMITTSQLSWTPSYATYAADASRVATSSPEVLVDEATGQEFNLELTHTEFDKEGEACAWAFRPVCRSRDFTVVIFND